MKNDMFKVSYFGCDDYGICSGPNMVKYNAAPNDGLVTKATGKKVAFRYALAAMQTKAAQSNNKVRRCSVNLKRLSNSEIVIECKRSKLETKDSSISPRGSHPRLASNDMIMSPINIPGLNAHFSKLGISFRRFIGFELSEMQAKDKTGQDSTSPDKFMLPPAEIANFNKIDEWKQFVHELLENVEDPAEKKLLKGTYRMMEIAIKLEHVLYSNTPNLDKASRLLVKLKRKVWPTVDVSKLQHIPDAIDVIRSACHYVGVIEEVVDEDEADKILDTIENIRDFASDVFGNIIVSLSLPRLLQCSDFKN